MILSYRKPEFSRAKPDNVEGIKQLLADPAAGPLARLQVDFPVGPLEGLDAGAEVAVIPL